MAFNATAAAAAHGAAQQLYANVDLSKLSWLEQLWAAWYIWIDNPIIATGLMSFLMHEIVYFGRCVPWIIIDAIPYFQKWKLQPNKIPTPQEQWECTKQVLFSHFTIELPAIWLFHPMAETFGMQTYQVPFPSWQTMLPQIAVFFVFEDMFHYFAHQALHWGVLYKYIHKIHHKYSAPFGLAAEYAHPAEVFILGTGTIAGPILYCYFTRNLHIFTVYIWITLRLFQAIDAHSGYDFPWSLQHIVPFWSGAEHHDFHHMAFTNNYSTSFRWCDRLFGTDDKYLEYRKRIAASKAAMKGKSKAEQDAVERKLIEEIEAEGQRAEAIAEGSIKTVKTLEIVFDHLGDGDLARILVVNAHFYQIAARVLYRAIDVSGSRAVRVVKILARNDAYPPLVRRFDVDFTENVLTLAFLRLLYRVLARLPNLINLGLDFSTVNTRFDIAWVLPTHAFALDTFTTTLRCDPALAHFLAAQPHLSELCLRGASSDEHPTPTLPIPPTALPHLRHLRIVLFAPHITAALVRARPVTSASISFDAASVHASLDALLLSARPIERLTVMSFDVSPRTLLADVAARMPGLEALHAVMFVPHAMHAHDVLVDAAPELTGFTALRYLTFMAPGASPSSSTSPSTPAFDTESVIARLWHTACPTLKTIILPRGIVWALVDGQWVSLHNT